MATCKNCLHIEACKQWYPKLPDKYHDGCEYFMDKSGYIPAAHGYWITERATYQGNMGEHYYRCSVCNMPKTNPRNHCGDCGAAMDFIEPLKDDLPTDFIKRDELLKELKSHIAHAHGEEHRVLADIIELVNKMPTEGR